MVRPWVQVTRGAEGTSPRKFYGAASGSPGPPEFQPCLRLKVHQH